MRLRDLLDESAVKAELESTDREECIEEMVDLLVRTGRVTDRAGVLAAIRARESQCSTGVGKGIAVPHGKHASIRKLTVALGRSTRGIDFDAVDRAPVYVVFLILATVNDPGPHMWALAEIGRLLSTPGFSQKIRAATSARAVLDALDGEE